MDDIIRQDLENIKKNLNGEIFTSKKVLVTGGAGFIGSWICDLVTDFGAQVTVVDDLSTGRIENIEHLIKQAQIKFIQTDVCTFRSDEKFDFIIHMAGHASPDEYQTHPIQTLQTSATGTFVMAELARKNDATLLFSSTSETYGDTKIIPTPETYWGNVNPIGPRSCYDEGKRFAEALLVAYNKQYNLDVKIPRIFNSYGPRLREDGLYGRALSRFIAQALAKQDITVYGDGKQTRSFCYISDTITGLLLLATNPNAKGEVVNVGNTQEITIHELAQKIKEITQSKSPITFQPLPKDDPKRRCPDTTKLEKIVGWKPKIELQEGLKKTITWFTK
ncbi:UDP-glucuronic acid decarboxylase family protein [Candidatus Bathycorpusculum sp.]|uniref:UDP-glucuronic acid decarboxylase family protein n=1 Tax=Candidatus Bathycorpusculum sp. TaxID=2994959 RepID=UPI002821AEAA|nr:SDR family oxidoreductase [Candidatus Termitimicrobium sp.]MCL2685481.1 SDR family oxidoreductase [Candidatus Termitimicrobium sp.]